MPQHEDPRVVRSRSAILEAARRVFLAEGYHAASVDAVAAEAGLAKRTIYNLYADKERLFRATILSAIDVADAFAASLARDVRSTEPTTDRLEAVGMRLAEATLLGPAIPLRRLLVMESLRFPDLVREYRERAPEAVMAALAELLEAMSASGVLRIEDAAVGAEHFAFLVMGADLDRGTFTGHRPSAARVRSRARAGAGAFVRAYAVRG